MKHTLIFFLAMLAFLSGCKESQSIHSDYAGKINYVKPHAPVDMEFTASSKPRAGESHRYELVITAGEAADDLIVSVTADEGVLLLEYPQQTRLGAQKKKQQHRMFVLCQPQQDGMFYLHVQATLVQGSQTQSRSFAIPLNVGDVDVKKHLKSSGTVTEDASGERIISMPAQESSKPAR